ncbi:hypothetical protein P3T21_007482 [Paraburkholderia sp. GAS334]
MGIGTGNTTDGQNGVGHAIFGAHDQIVDRSDRVRALVVDGRADDPGGPVSGRQLNDIAPGRVLIDCTVPWARKVSVTKAVASISAHVTIANFVSTSLRVSQRRSEWGRQARSCHSRRKPCCSLHALLPLSVCASLRRADSRHARSASVVSRNVISYSPMHSLYRSGGDGDGDMAQRQRRGQARRLRKLLSQPGRGGNPSMDQFCTGGRP